MEGNGFAREEGYGASRSPRSGQRFSRTARQGASSEGRRAGRLVGGALALSLLAALLAGCGGSDESADSSQSSGGAATSSSSGGSGASEVAEVVDAANAFAESLDEDQANKALLDFTQKNATAWSNLPCGQSCRGGVPLKNLDDDQKALAEELLQTALGSGEAGYGRVENIRAADDHLKELQSSGQGAGPGGAPPEGGAPPGGAPPDGGNPPSGGAAPPDGGAGGGGLGGYGGQLYDLAILGDPSTSGTWQLHFGGHHLAVNFTYVDGKVAGPTPYFVGVEPTSWAADGTEYAPMQDMAEAVKAVTGSLSEDQMSSAKLSESFTDVLVGPGEDGQFPETEEGLAVSELSAEQKELVLDAMRSWVGIVEDATSEDLMSTYESELDETYIGWSGGTDLTQQGDYFRIDGPSAWIEFVCQNGVVVQGRVHYHTIWRDKTRDYGGEFSF